MDRIGQLPDELLLRILSSLPSAQDVVATMVLSKRWKPLWKSVPKLVYDDYSFRNIEYERFSYFVYTSFIPQRAPLDTLHFKLGQDSDPFEIAIWLFTVGQDFVRQLILDMDCSSCGNPLLLPMCFLSAGCKMLVTLKLNNVVLLDNPSMPCFPTLKTLSLLSVKYPGGDEFVKRLLSSCHVLEDLVVERCPDDYVTTFTVRVPSLMSCVLRTSEDIDAYGEDGFVIDAPSLKFLEILDHSGASCVIENNMPNIVKANVDVADSYPWKILRSITSVKDLYLCFPISKDAYPAGCVFHSLVHLKICTCDRRWLNLLMRFLRDSPNLQALKLEQCHTCLAEPHPRWRKPSSVPECVLSSIETLEWVKYEGAIEEKELATFILRNAKYLKKAIIFFKSTDPNRKLEMIKELSSSPRCSLSCELIFD